MENIYDPEKFLFRYTNTQRTEASYKAFVEGLFGENAYQHIQVPAPLQNNDTLLRVRTKIFLYFTDHSFEINFFFLIFLAIRQLPDLGY